VEVVADEVRRRRGFGRRRRHGPAH
jgi:hypothetical protein